MNKIELLKSVIQEAKNTSCSENLITINPSLLLEKDLFEKINSIKNFYNGLIIFENPEMGKKDNIVVSDIFLAGAIFLYNSFFGHNNMLSSSNEQKWLELIDDINELILSKGSIKNRIKECMNHKNISQKKLSEITGIDKSNLSGYMNNKSQPSLDFFLPMWSALGYPRIKDLLYKLQD